MRRSVEQGMQRPLVWKSVDMGVYAGRSREGRQLLKDRYDGMWVGERFESKGERRAWKKRQRGKNATGAGKKGSLRVVWKV